MSCWMVSSRIRVGRVSQPVRSTWTGLETRPTRCVWVARLLLGLILFATLLSLAAQAAPFVPARDAQCVAFSSDGALVATGISGLSNEEFPPGPHPSPRKCGVVQIYSVDQRKRLRRMETFGDLTKIGFSADDKLIAAARLFVTSDKLQLNEVRVWEVATGSAKFVFDRCQAFCFAPRGNAIAVVSRRRCLVYDLTTGDKLNEYPAFANALSVQYSPGGDRLAGIVATTAGFELRVCDVAGAEPPAVATPLSEPFYNVAFSPDGVWLASGHPAGNVLLWEARTLQPRSRFQSGGRGLQHPFFSPDGALLAAGDQTNGDVVFWNPSSGEEVRRYTFEKGAFHTYRVRGEGELVAPERDPVRFVFAPDGQAFLAGPNGGIIREIANGQYTHRFGD